MSETNGEWTSGGLIEIGDQRWWYGDLRPDRLPQTEHAKAIWEIAHGPAPERPPDSASLRQTHTDSRG